MGLDGKRVLVAGATGLAGAGVLTALREQAPGARIRATWHRHPPWQREEGVEYAQGDLTSPEDCRRLAAGCDGAVMVAARTSGAGVLTTRPWEQVNDNLIMNAVLVQALAEAGVRRLVLVGSATLYQEFEGFIREDQLDLNRDPPGAYLGVGWVTRYVEKSCRFWHEQSGMNIVLVRASNIFGPFARFDPATSNFIPALIRKAVDRLDPFEVWGSPDVTRDVIYVADFARAVVMMLEREDLTFDVFNIGSGVRTTVGQVVEWALKHAGHAPSRIAYNSDRPTTSPFRALDCTKAYEVLGWAPRVGVEEGIKNTTGWWNVTRDRWTR